MKSQPNIFEQLSADNDFEDFSEVVEYPLKKSQETQFDDISNLETSKGNIFYDVANQQKKNQEDKFGFLDTSKDIAEQVVSKGISGIGGAYGNILDSFGLQMKEGKKLPGKEVRDSMQSQVLEKINRGEPPSFGELMLLSDDDDLTNLRFPNSKDIQSGIEDVSGVGEGKTPAGRILGLGAQFLGEGAVLGGGGKALAVMGGSGGAGQTVRELGGPEWLANGLEIVPNLFNGAFTSKLAPTSKAAKETVNSGRKIGLTEKQITALVQGEKKLATLSKVARKGTKTKELFASIKKKLGDSYDSIKSRPEATKRLTPLEQNNIRKDFSKVKNELSKTLAPSPDREAAINFIEKSMDTLKNNTQITPEYLINFWQDINKSVKWNSIQGGKKSLAKLKEPIASALEKCSPQLAKDFEMTNELYSKYAQISKKLKPDLVDAFVNKAEVLAIAPAAISLIQGNPWAMTALAGESVLRILGREMLINPYFQNVAKKLVTNINSASVKGVSELVNQTKQYMERKHPEEDWSFLNED